MLRRSLIALALTLLTVRCADEHGALPTGMAPTADVMTPDDATARTLHQDARPAAPEPYQMSFWVRRDEPTDVRVDYVPGAGRREGDRFLQFQIPDNGIAGWPGAEQLGKHDSVEITLTIDPVLLSVHFEP